MTTDKSDQNDQNDQNDLPDLPVGDERIRRAAGEPPARAAGHPDPDELFAYHEGRLSRSSAERVQEHLVHCADCSAAVLDFAEFPHLEPPDASLRLSEAQVEERWRSVEREIASRRRPLHRRSEVLLPLAALFFFATIGLGLWVSALRQQVDALRGPRGDVYVMADLRPGGGATRGEPTARRLPAWAERAVVLLALAPGADYPSYEVEVSGPDGGGRLATLPVYQTPEGGFAVEVPARLLASPGRHRFALYGLEGTGRELLAEYPLRIEIP
ncbi:MAG: zf-HC2 domain-containing protein [Acidobacteriota bacterium]|jgi:hypothetical protein